MVVGGVMVGVEVGVSVLLLMEFVGSVNDVVVKVRVFGADLEVRLRFVVLLDAKAVCGDVQ